MPPVTGREKLASGGGGGGGASEQVKEARGWRWLPFSLGLGKTVFS